MTLRPPLTPEDDAPGCVPFAGFTGAGVRVAVIDSGVNVLHPHIAGVCGGVAITADGAAEGDFSDRLGHGTAVMAAIQEKALAAEYLAVRVFDRDLRTSASNLIRAIEWCIEKEVQVVNLSLGTTNPAHEKAFLRVVADALDAGVQLVAARDANGQICYPGSLPGVAGVGLDWDCPRSVFRCGRRGEGALYYASGYPRPAPGVPRTRNLYGISFAVANMSAFIARACETDPGAMDSGRTARVHEALTCESAAISACL